MNLIFSVPYVNFQFYLLLLTTMESSTYIVLAALHKRHYKQRSILLHLIDYYFITICCCWTHSFRYHPSSWLEFGFEESKIFILRLNWFFFLKFLVAKYVYNADNCIFNIILKLKNQFPNYAQSTFKIFSSIYIFVKKFFSQNLKILGVTTML